MRVPLAVEHISDHRALCHHDAPVFGVLDAASGFSDDDSSSSDDEEGADDAAEFRLPPLSRRLAVQRMALRDELRAVHALHAPVLRAITTKRPRLAHPS
jgi:predicted HD phosphohydrolase